MLPPLDVGTQIGISCHHARCDSRDVLKQGKNLHKTVTSSL